MFACYSFSGIHQTIGGIWILNVQKGSKETCQHRVLNNSKIFWLFDIIKCRDIPQYSVNNQFCQV